MRHSGRFSAYRSACANSVLNRFARRVHRVACYIRFTLAVDLYQPMNAEQGQALRIVAVHHKSILRVDGRCSRPRLTVSINQLNAPAINRLVQRDLCVNALHISRVICVCERFKPRVILGHVLHRVADQVAACHGSDVLRVRVHQPIVRQPRRACAVRDLRQADIILMQLRQPVRF